jgi:hypothetical protein
MWHRRAWEQLSYDAMIHTSVSMGLGGDLDSIRSRMGRCTRACHLGDSHGVIGSLKALKEVYFGR